MEASSTINTPHPDDEADLFFGDGEDDGETAGTAGAEGEPEAEAEEGAEFDTAAQKKAAEEYRERTGEPESSHTQTAEQTAELAAAREALDDATDPEDDEHVEPTPEPPGEQPAAAEANGKKSGPLEREYIVLHQVPLTEKVLKHLLAQIEEGNAAEPRLAFFEINRVTTRNVNAAVAATYNEFKEKLGAKADMAAVSSKAFQKRHVEPKKVETTNLSITN